MIIFLTLLKDLIFLPAESSYMWERHLWVLWVHQSDAQGRRLLRQQVTGNGCPVGEVLSLHP
jgi:hypothetical protein